jgi:uncharacterized protein (DUF2141 family)
MWISTVSAVRADSLSSAIFVRADTDHTVVVSPRAHVEHSFDPQTQLDVTYAADIWTSASVDVRAMATVPVTEQRDELDVGVNHAWEDISAGASYRYSVENDYVSHGVSANGRLDLAQNSTSIAAAVYGFSDTVGRSGQPSFSRDLFTLGARATLTQILDTQTLLQLTYELSQLNGYQASPYRYVGIGGSGFGCEAASECMPEHMPHDRRRHAIALLARRAISENIALGASYRFYLDDWQLHSHTLSADLSFMPSEQTRFVLSYRFYTQTGVYFYLPVYSRYLGSTGYTTRDREQSPMHDQRVGLEWMQTLLLDSSDTRLRMHASVGGLLFKYENFRGLDAVRALELTLAVSLER